MAAAGIPTSAALLFLTRGRGLRRHWLRNFNVLYRHSSYWCRAGVQAGAKRASGSVDDVAINRQTASMPRCQLANSLQMLGIVVDQTLRQIFDTDLAALLMNAGLFPVAQGKVHQA